MQTDEHRNSVGVNPLRLSSNKAINIKHRSQILQKLFISCKRGK
jgi:hypothetical protein